MSKLAHVLALKANTFPIPLAFGIRPIGEDGLAPLLAAQAWIGPRMVSLDPTVQNSKGAIEVLEADPSFIQIIPYVLVRQGGKLLTYVRTEAGGEARLHGKFSIGVGGHIDLPDIVVDESPVMEKGKEIPINRIDIITTLTRSAVREISEEIGIEIPVNALHWTHLIHIDDTPVDRVHLGLVAVIDLDEAGVSTMTFEDAIGDATFETVEELAAGRVNGMEAEAENWTRLVLEMLVKDAVGA